MMADTTLEERLGKLEARLAVLQRSSVYGYITLLRLKISGLPFDEDADAALDEMDKAVVEALKLKGGELSYD